jgi:hypothetical protein
LLYLLDEVERAMLERQCGVGLALAQIQFRLPHLVERGFERGSRGRVEQRRGFGDVVDVAVLGFDVAGVAEFRASFTGFSAARARRRARRLASRHRMSGVDGGFRVAFGFFAEKLAIAQAQDLLIDADRVGAREEFRVVERRLVGKQRFGVDDDLALAAEIRGHGFLRDAVEAAAVLRRIRRPAQDQARASRDIRFRHAIVGDDESHDDFVALGERQRAEIERVPIALATRAVERVAVERDRAFVELDVLAVALRMRHRKFGLGDAVVVVRLEFERPGFLRAVVFGQGLVRHDDANRRRAIDDDVDAMQVVAERWRAVEFDAVETRCGERAFAHPVAAVAMQIDAAAVVEREMRGLRFRVEMQRHASVESCGTFASSAVSLRAGISVYAGGVIASRAETRWAAALSAAAFFSCRASTCSRTLGHAAASTNNASAAMALAKIARCGHGGRTSTSMFARRDSRRSRCNCCNGVSAPGSRQSSAALSSSVGERVEATRERDPSSRDANRQATNATAANATSEVASATRHPPTRAASAMTPNARDRAGTCNERMTLAHGATPLRELGCDGRAHASASRGRIVATMRSSANNAAIAIASHASSATALSPASAGVTATSAPMRSGSAAAANARLGGRLATKCREQPVGEICVEQQRQIGRRECSAAR